MSTPKSRALNMRMRKLNNGKFALNVNECEECRKEVGLHHRVRISNIRFKPERLEYMKLLCIDCAASECKLPMAVIKGKVTDPTRDKYYTGPKGKGYKECTRALNRAEKTKTL